MKSLTILSLALTFALITVGHGLAAEKELKPQTKCPVMGGDINKEVFVDHEGQRIYFCCPGCIKKFKADPEEYLKKMEEQGIALAETPNPQTNCPVKEGKIDKEVFFDHEGKRVYFCCSGCIVKFLDDPEGYIKTMEDKGITLEKTPNKEFHLRGTGEGEKHEHQH